MKRSFNLIMLLSIILIGWEYYETIFVYRTGDVRTRAELSDIAEKVKAIPLKYKGNIRTDETRHIRIHGNDLFLISRNTLYRFDISGRFVCRITDPEKITVATYLIDAKNHQLIVLANENSAHYYTFNGLQTDSRKLTDDNARLLRLKTAEIYNNHIYTAEERIKVDPIFQEKHIEMMLVKYDISFREIEKYRLASANLPGKPIFMSFNDIEIGIEADKGNIYACSSPISPDKLLADSLELSRYALPANESAIPVYPVRIGRRFYISSYSSASNGLSDYIYCFDRDTSHSWIVSHIDDNFYKTGAVNRLEFMDEYSQTCCFCKSGEDLRQSFPEYADAQNPVIFVVSLKG